MPEAAEDPRSSVQPLIVRLPSELHTAIKERAASDDLSMSQLVRRALRDYLSQSPVPLQPAN